MAKSVLVVEDEDSIALALEFLIQREGYEIDRVSTGPAAIEAIRQKRPALVLLDVMLPGCSGYEVCEQIRGVDGGTEIKVLMMTASGGALEKRKAIAMGADAFISKPFSPVELIDTVNRLIEDEVA
ncbi:MAG: response regulator [Pseudomonadota bacterium]